MPLFASTASRPRPLLPLLGAALTTCAHLPIPLLVLTLERPNATTTRATLTPTPAQARWTVGPADDRRADLDAVREAGDWPTSVLEVRAWRGDLLTVTLEDGSVVAECVPPMGWASVLGRRSL